MRNPRAASIIFTSYIWLMRAEKKFDLVSRGPNKTHRCFLRASVTQMPSCVSHFTSLASVGWHCTMQLFPTAVNTGVSLVALSTRHGFPSRVYLLVPLPWVWYLLRSVCTLLYLCASIGAKYNLRPPLQLLHRGLWIRFSSVYQKQYQQQSKLLRRVI